MAVKAADRGRLTEQELADQLLAVLSEAPGLRPPPLLALLTASDRDTWGKARDILLNQGWIVCIFILIFMFFLSSQLGMPFSRCLQKVQSPWDFCAVHTFLKIHSGGPRGNNFILGL